MMDIIFIPVPIAATVPPIDAIQLSDGRRGATVRSLCQILDIAPNMQVVRIRRSPKLAQALVTTQVDTPGGPQQTDVLLDWAISIWASGLHISRLPEKKQALAQIVQREAFAAIERAFAELRTKNASPEACAPQAPAPEAPQRSLRRVKQKLLLAAEGLTSAAEEVGHFDAEYQILVERVTALESGPARPTIGVSPQRLAQVYLLAYRVQQRHGYRIDETLAGLAAHFRVENIYYLPEKHWPGVLDWFASLLEE